MRPSVLSAHPSEAIPMSTAVVAKPASARAQTWSPGAAPSSTIAAGGRRRSLIKWRRNSYRAWAVMWSDIGRSYRRCGEMIRFHRGSLAGPPRAPAAEEYARWHSTLRWKPTSRTLHMRMGINVSLVSSTATYRQTGVSRYISELDNALRTPLADGDSLVRMGDSHNRLRQWPPARLVWEQTVLAMNARRERLDVLHSPVNVVPLAWGGASVVTVHDLAFLRDPDHVSLRRRAWLGMAVKRSVRAADRVIAVSTNTADDLTDWVDVPRSRIDVIPSAPSPQIRPVRGQALDTFRERRGITRPFVLAVGTLEPRKNLPTLLRAFAAIRGKLPHDLVMIGPDGWMTGELWRTIRELDLGGRLRMT